MIPLINFKCFCFLQQLSPLRPCWFIFPIFLTFYFDSLAGFKQINKICMRVCLTYAKPKCYEPPHSGTMRWDKFVLHQYKCPTSTLLCLDVRVLFTN